MDNIESLKEMIKEATKEVIKEVREEMKKDLHSIVSKEIRRARGEKGYKDHCDGCEKRLKCLAEPDKQQCIKESQIDWLKMLRDNQPAGTGTETGIWTDHTTNYPYTTSLNPDGTSNMVIDNNTFANQIYNNSGTQVNDNSTVQWIDKGTSTDEQK